MNFQEGRKPIKQTCSKCGKTMPSVKAGRGSITSWLFRPAECRCEQPGSKSIDQALTGPALKTVESNKHAADSERSSITLGFRLPPGELIDGRYRILQQVGAGGMGTVYRVLDQATNTTYALKVIASHLAEQKMVAKRFEQEARAAKALTHPNIVAVYDVGRTNSNVPYLIMDYIEGQTLADRLKSDLFLDSSQAINIFVQVAEALSYAHKHGVIHRDLKPSNIMLTRTADGVDTVKIADFGIAKVIEPAGVEATKLTLTGELLGSPSYMSPEQCRGDVTDARSDVYSVGCMMYEALSGQTPFEGENPVRIILKHISEEPPRLKNNVAPVSSELQSVVMRCLAKHPHERYASADEFRVDLERIQQGKKPLAPRKGVRWSLDLRRNPVRVASFLGLALVYIIVGVVCAELWPSFSPHSTSKQVHLATNPIEAWKDFDMSGQEDFNTGKYDLAERQFQAAIDVASTFEKSDRLVLTLNKQAVLFHVLGKLSEEKAVDAKLLNAKFADFKPELPAPGSARKVVSDEDLDKLRTTILTNAKAIDAKFAEFKPRGPGSARKLVSDKDKVLDKLRTTLLTSAKEKKQLIDVCEQINEHAMHSLDNGDYESDAPLLQEAFKRECKVLGETDPLVAETLSFLAAIANHQRNYHQAETLGSRVLAIRKQQLKPFDPDIADALHFLGEVLNTEGKYSDAEQLFEQEIAIYKKSQDLDKVKDSIAHSYGNLAYSAEKQSQYGRAIELYTQAIDFHQSAGNSEEAAELLEPLCMLYWATRQRSEAEAEIAQLLARARAAFRNDDQTIAMYLATLGEIYQYADSKGPRQMSQVISLYKEALAIRQHQLLPESEEVVRTLRDLVCAYVAIGNSLAAEPLARQRLAILERRYATRYIYQPEELVSPLLRLSNVCMSLGKRQEAHTLLRRITDIMFYSRLPLEVFDQIDGGFYELANVFYSESDYSRLEKLIQESLELAEKRFGPDHGVVAAWLDHLANFYCVRGRYAEAWELERKAATIVRKNPGMSRDRTARILRHEAKVLRVMGRALESGAVEVESDNSAKYRYESNVEKPLRPNSSVVVDREML